MLIFKTESAFSTAARRLLKADSHLPGTLQIRPLSPMEMTFSANWEPRPHGKTFLGWKIGKRFVWLLNRSTEKGTETEPTIAVAKGKALGKRAVCFLSVSPGE